MTDFSPESISSIVVPDFTKPLNQSSDLVVPTFTTANDKEAKALDELAEAKARVEDAISLSQALNTEVADDTIPLQVHRRESKLNQIEAILRGTSIDSQQLKKAMVKIEKVIG